LSRQLRNPKIFSRIGSGVISKLSAMAKNKFFFYQNQLNTTITYFSLLLGWEKTEQFKLVSIWFQFLG
jgi:hypothetical protein